MSSTKRGADRHKDDLYETPEWLTKAIVPYLGPRLPDLVNAFEPAAGRGRMLKVLKEELPDWNFDAADINGTPTSEPADFLISQPSPKYDLIITNPPYSLAMEFVKRALMWRRTPSSVVAMLLRLNFAGSKGRASWLREHPPAVYITPKRPSFTPNNTTDSIEYAWFLWQEPYREYSGIHWLDTENCDDPSNGIGRVESFDESIVGW